jgi:hypothetical protein
LIQRRLGVATPLLALTVIGAAIVLISNGYVLLGCVVLLLAIPSTWLGGLWVMPNSVDAYARRIVPLLRDDFVEATWESRRQDERLRAITAAIAQLEPPHDFMELHARVLGVLREIEGMKRGDPEMLADEAIEVIELRRQLLQIRSELDGYAAEPYLAKLAEALDARVGVTKATAEAVQRPLLHQKEGLQRVKVPRSWLSLHSAYLEQLTSYLAVRETHYRAVGDNNVAEAKRTACLLGTQQRAVETLANKYRAALWGYYSGRGL